MSYEHVSCAKQWGLCRGRLAPDADERVWNDEPRDNDRLADPNSHSHSNSDRAGGHQTGRSIAFERRGGE